MLAFVAFGAWHSTMGQQAAFPVVRELKTYPLNGRINSADLSPDETVVAIERTTQDKIENTGVDRFSDLVELWDFRPNKLLAHFILKAMDVQHSGRGMSVDPVKGARFVRFTADGKLIVAYVDRTIYVLQGNDLSEVKTIAVEGPPSINHTYHSKRTGLHTYAERSELVAFETSPTGRLLATLWARGLYGRIDIYDISTGREVATWETPRAPIGYDADCGLKWSPTSQTIFLAAPNSSRCFHPGLSPDVFGFDSATGTVKTSLTTGLLVGDIAVTPGGQLLAVDSDCVGAFTNHHPRLEVFDLRTNKDVRNIRGGKSGVRYRVSVSRNGQRAAAWTSHEICSFDWLDMDCADRLLDTVFTVWHLPDFTVITTSRAPFAGRVSTMKGIGALRLSSTGHYLLVYGTEGFVFELP